MARITLNVGVQGALDTISLKFLTDPITMSVEQANFAEKRLIGNVDYVCSYTDANGRVTKLAPTLTIEGTHPD